MRLPNGTPLISAADFRIRPSERLLVTGPSGAGKSTLFRAIAGIWPFGNGSIAIPANASLMMLPQKPYFPIGTLHAAVAFPSEASAFSIDRIKEVLTEVGLPQLAARLDEQEHWNRVLSLGEQQRLGIARALLQSPQFLFLDEATASLDEPSEAALYHLLQRSFPAPRWSRSAIARRSTHSTSARSRSPATAITTRCRAAANAPRRSACAGGDGKRARYGGTAGPQSPKEKGGGLLRRPSVIPSPEAYFRLVIAVRSADSLAMPAAPHQLEPTPVGLIAVMLVVPLAAEIAGEGVAVTLRTGWCRSNADPA